MQDLHIFRVFEYAVSCGIRILPVQESVHWHESQVSILVQLLRYAVSYFERVAA
jgi:hypothetical protein